MTDTPAIRTVSEDDDVHVIEARIAFGGPFNGRDSYGTLFSARTDFGLDLHPQGIPVLYNHGFDPDMGLHPLGFTEPTGAFRVADDGVWVKMQLDKRNAYYATRVRPLLDANALGVSQGSAEHSVDIDARTGEVIAWPLHEVSLTPTEANPWSVIAARTGDTIRIVASLRAENAEGEPEGGPVGGKAREDIPDEDYAGPDKSFPIVDQASVESAARLIGKADDPEAVKAKVTAIAKRKGLELPDAWTESARTAIRMAGGDAGMAAQAMQTILFLRDCEAGEADQVAMLDRAVAALQDFVTAELAEPAPDDDDMPAMMSGVRAGRRNAAADLARIDAIHDHTVALGASAHMGDMAQGDDNSGESEDEAARSGETVPAMRVVEPADPDAERRRISEFAATAAEAALRAFRGDVG